MPQGQKEGGSVHVARDAIVAHRHHSAPPSNPARIPVHERAINGISLKKSNWKTRFEKGKKRRRRTKEKRGKREERKSKEKRKSGRQAGGEGSRKSREKEKRGGKKKEGKEDNWRKGRHDRAIKAIMTAQKNYGDA
ncbi:hypothetical protein M440DRAFT_1406888 [Trichoderma longibrachiatum ATCC 18648]|uniref:Uncharacterized protein n=1 Tax=Trichoderma longibrachiatum ATCC 18648 TaxID=983965 RepID=A0A2T4BP11_TRILO|nr:hypothetical protein M440DRAFT_1406888 [Trichoderma longibrachiatum ATCC 18648]